jgi:hypothetical protein
MVKKKNNQRRDREMSNSGKGHHNSTGSSRTWGSRSEQEVSLPRRYYHNITSKQLSTDGGTTSSLGEKKPLTT